VLHKNEHDEERHLVDHEKPIVCPLLAYSVEKLLSEKQTRMRAACFSFLRVNKSIPRVSHTQNFAGKARARLGTDFFNRIGTKLPFCCGQFHLLSTPKQTFLR
jgi:hypothetical protein